MPALYLHIPFCQRKCPYCDFNTYAGREARYAAYSSALAKDIERQGLELGRPPAPSLFLGGGTPTVLESEQLQQVLEAARAGFALDPAAEISSEANPGTVDQARFETLRRLGVNRLSMGVQSFDAADLAFLGRIHSADEATHAFALARQVGFTNINLDFMFGLPQQQPASWERTLRQAIELEPEHLSLYSLIVEDDTPLATWVARGQVGEPDPDLAADLYEMACEVLADAGYFHYEISNWARGPMQADGLPAFACRHNLAYWRNESYLGFGPGAYSSGAGRRWAVGRSVEGYIAGVESDVPPRDYEEEIGVALAMGETMMLGLRLLDVGVSRAAFRQRFGVDIIEVYAAEVAGFQARGWVEVTEACVRLTPQAWLVGNEVFAAFLP